MALTIKNLGFKKPNTSGVHDLYTVPQGKSAIVNGISVACTSSAVITKVTVTISGASAVEIQPVKSVLGSVRIALTDKITLAANDKISVDLATNPAGNMLCLVSGLERDV